MMTLEKLIAEKRAEVEALRHKLALCEVELRAYERAATAVAGSHAERPAAPRPPRQSALTASSMSSRQTGHWAAFLNDIREFYPEKFTIDDAMLIAEAGSYPINRNAMRSNLANYVNKGVVERVSHGVFRLTQLGESATMPKTDAAPDFSGAHTNPNYG